jgi:hypothetical protein
MKVNVSGHDVEVAEVQLPATYAELLHRAEVFRRNAEDTEAVDDLARRMWVLMFVREQLTDYLHVEKQIEDRCRAEIRSLQAGIARWARERWPELELVSAVND